MLLNKICNTNKELEKLNKSFQNLVDSFTKEYSLYDYNKNYIIHIARRVFSYYKENYIKEYDFFYSFKFSETWNDSSKKFEKDEKKVLIKEDNTNLGFIIKLEDITSLLDKDYYLFYLKNNRGIITFDEFKEKFSDTEKCLDFIQSKHESHITGCEYKIYLIDVKELEISNMVLFLNR